jgi:hypothetical protein
MGRNSLTINSKITIRIENIPLILRKLEYENTNDFTDGDALADCLGDFYLHPTGHDQSGFHEFIVADGDTDEDYDTGVFVEIAVYLHEGSFYEQADDSYLSVLEIKGGRLLESQYDLEWDGQAQEVGRGELVFQREFATAPADVVEELLNSSANVASVDKSISSNSEDVDSWDAVSNWWQLDDPDWVKQRNQDWRVISKNLKRMTWSAKQIKMMKHYFMTGEDLEDARYFGLTDRFLCAPYESAEQAKQLYHLYTNVHFDQEKLIRRHQRLIGELYDGLPTVREKVRNFQTGVIGDKYQPVTAIKREKEVTLTYPPAQIVKKWSDNAKYWLESRNSGAYGIYTDQMQYLFSVLEHLDRSGETIPESFGELKEFVDFINGVVGLSPYQQEFCDTFLAEFDRDDLPNSVVSVLANCAPPLFLSDLEVAVEEQLAELEKIDLGLNQATELDELFQQVSRQSMERMPYAGLLISMGGQRSIDETPLSNTIYQYFHREAYTPGAHARTILRLDGLAGWALGIENTEELHDTREIESWLRFNSMGKPSTLTLNGYRKEVQFRAIALWYDERLRELDTGLRIYMDDMGFGDVKLVAAFTENQITKFRNLSRIHMVTFNELSEKYGCD